MSFPSAILDNDEHGTVADFLKESITPNSALSFVSAYFTIYAYQGLRERLDSIDRLRFLFGEPTFIKALDPDKVSPREFHIEDNGLSIPLECRLSQKSVARDCAAWLNDKADIRSMVKPNFLHGKLYHIRQENGVQKAVAGSSNFTVHGMGLGKSHNIELNMIVDGDRDRDALLEWFERIWNDRTGLVEDVKEEVLRYLSQLYSENSPEFIYYKTLFHVFESFLDDQKKSGLLDERTGFYDSQVWNTLYSFQQDGVRGAINKIIKHNGCILADSVGLGKTYEALAVIKYFELLNARVLVLCPKKLKSNWTIYQASQGHRLNPFPADRFGYTLLHHTDLGRETGLSDANGINLASFNWKNFDLVVIDESHNFRGNPVEREKKDGSRRQNRALWLMERIIKDGVKTRVLMLSATPVNNELRDLRNQIAFITEGRNDALFENCRIRDISQTLKTAQSQFTLWADPQKNPQRTLRQLLERLDSSFFKLLDELTIARSRHHIQRFYALDQIGAFPERNKPLAIYPEIDQKKRFPSYERINKQILEYKLSVFNPSSYVLEEHQAKYETMAGTSVLGFNQKQRETYLIGMMKVNYLKRLESSIHSFAASLERTLGKIESVIQRIEAFQNKTDTNPLELENLPIPDDEQEENGDEQEDWQVGVKLKFDLADLRLGEWLADLRSDREALIDLLNNAEAVGPERDAKMAELRRIIAGKMTAPVNPNNRKVLVFTAFADTARYLYDNLKDWCQSELKIHCALVCGSETRTNLGSSDFDSILTHFAPRAKNRAGLIPNAPDEEIDLLIATDCISEGQNLQDCDLVVNYDIHWNPVRIIQRFGRIDRLGSPNQSIQLINFWPTKDLDHYINLKHRVEARMALVDVTATGEDNLLGNKQIEDLITEDLKYRNQQLKRLKEEVLDLEEMGDGVSLTDFTLDDFRIELLRFIDANRQRLSQAPFGLYAVVPSPQSPSGSPPVAPGVIFCLRHKNHLPEHADLNPLSPYFLAYVRDDGTVRYQYPQAKQILELMRRLCEGQKEPFADLCRLFNYETRDGQEMGRYNGLLQAAAQSLSMTFKKRSTQRLTLDRHALIPPVEHLPTGLDDFDLITWLVIR